ncbi:hypothetical protein [Micromonospora sp. WMMD710]|uniref:hypothetical protein n=1 Tax=Micromonospora sp. WMMD710 TaxID=3016085 RepID=UPI0024162631|nr:hypothetical protein [Micromonospora sp. WMMD710]MDG4757966.1 hypothetical protein [Micromonospora sp. WMMD710]
MLVWTVPDGQTRYALVDPPAAQSYPVEPGPPVSGARDARLAAAAAPWGTAGAPAHRIADAAAVLAVVLSLLWLGRITMLVFVARLLLGTAVVPG